MSHTVKVIALNTFSGYLRLGVTMLVTFFLTPFVIRTTGAEGYGLWSFVISAVGFFDLLDFGLATTVIKYTAECQSLHDYIRRNRLLSQILSIYVLIGLTGLLVAFILIPFIQYAVEEEYRSQALMLWIFLSVRTLGILLPCTVFRGALLGIQKIFAVNILSVFSSLLYGGLTYWFLTHHGSIVSVGYAIFTSTLLESVIIIFMSFYLLSPLHLRFEPYQWKEWRGILSFSTAQFISNMGTLVLHNVDIVIVKMFLSLEYVAFYAIPMRLASYGYMLLKQFTSSLTPLIVDRHTLGDSDKVREIFLIGGKFTWLGSAFLSISLFITGPDFIHLWIGHEFKEGMSVLYFLVTAFWLTAPVMLAGDTMILTGRYRLFSAYILAGVIVHVALSFGLAPIWGLNGVACGAVGGAIIGLLTFFRKVCHFQHISPFHTFWKLISVGLFPCILSILVFSGLKYGGGLHSWGAFMTTQVCGGIAFGLGMYQFSLNSQERKWIHRLLAL